MLADKSISEFVRATGSDAPVPGGGSVSALAGALAAALSAMVARLTIEKTESGAETKQQLLHLSEQADALQRELVQQVDRDAQAYEAFLCALRLPKTTQLEQAKRKSDISVAKKEICWIPFMIAQNALGVLRLAGNAIEIGRKDVITDSAVAVLLAGAAAKGALYNVKFNLSSVKDEAYVTQLQRKVEEMELRVKEEEKKWTTFASMAIP